MSRSALYYCALAAAVAGVSTTSAASSAQSQSAGFIEDSSLKLLMRNYYFNRDYRNGTSNVNRAAGTNNGYRGEWAQGFLSYYSSGFTQGTVGFGIDAHAFLGLKLDSGKGKTNTGLLPTNNEGEPQDDYSVAGLAAKARISNTVLKYGDMELTSPIFMTDQGAIRLFNSTVRGWNIVSRELDNFSFEASRVTSGRSAAQNDHASTIHSQYGTRPATDSLNIYGINYASGSLKASLYGMKAEDLWQQYLAMAQYVHQIDSDRSLRTNFVLYDTHESGAERGGKIDNTTWSLMAGFKTGPHTFSVAHQSVQGDSPFDYLGFSDGLTTLPQLANNVQIHDFNAPREKSWQLRYDLDMAPFGVPGLNLMARYIRGTGGDGSHIAADSMYAGRYQSGAKHWEQNLEARYVVQSGAAKDLSFRVRHAVHRGNGNEAREDMNELRVMIDYPINIF